MKSTSINSSAGARLERNTRHAGDAGPVLPPLELAILSRQGGRNYNEDACGHWNSDTHLCCVVADGAGGHGGGDIASKLAVRHIIEQFAAAPLSRPDEVTDLLLDTNATVIRHRADGEAQAHMHTTVVSLFIDLERGLALWGHAGDSRTCRDGQMLAHTRGPQRRAVAGRGPAVQQEDEMRTHPRRSELLSALGSAPEDLHVTAASKPWHMHRGRRVPALQPTGCGNLSTRPKLSASLNRAADPRAWLAALEELVLRHAAEAAKHTHDNFSAITVWCGRGH